MPFYRLNIIDFYNNNMGNVDLADQLRNHYRYDTSWHRNRKWWWSIWWWGFQLLLTNSYVLYRKYHEIHNSKEAMKHYDFIKAICLGWINREMFWPKAIGEGQAKRTQEDQIQTRGAKKKLDIDVSSFSSGGSTATINDKTLHPIHGKLKMRLNYSVQHLPECSRSKNPRCALHRWARNQSGPAVMSDAVVCTVCRVHLCIKCFGLFQKEANILGKKDEIAAM